MLKIGVIGRSQRAGEELPAHMLRAAEEVGRGIALRGAALINGGTGGVMEYSAKGAKEAGGLTVGFLPQADLSHANPYLDLAFPTGMGTLRNVLTARCADALVVIGGGVGTLNEITFAYDAAVPVVVLEGTTGWSDRLRQALYDEAYLDERRVISVSFAATAEEAVAEAFVRAAQPRLRSGSPLAGSAGH
ncbi:MAG: hypothetical protein JWN00_4305 [Actinomycetia bacterium]|jgi:uncharacterized protein (TIGR00725 family)|nr:hypothetical protein [Actinomycetes bacterium]